jgi:hypothetical protein
MLLRHGENEPRRLLNCQANYSVTFSLEALDVSSELVDVKGNVESVHQLVISTEDFECSRLREFFCALNSYRDSLAVEGLRIKEFESQVFSSLFEVIIFDVLANRFGERMVASAFC